MKLYMTPITSILHFTNSKHNSGRIQASNLNRIHDSNPNHNHKRNTNCNYNST